MTVIYTDHGNNRLNLWEKITFQYQPVIQIFISKKYLCKSINYQKWNTSTFEGYKINVQTIRKVVIIVGWKLWSIPKIMTEVLHFVCTWALWLEVETAFCQIFNFFKIDFNNIFVKLYHWLWIIMRISSDVSRWLSSRVCMEKSSPVLSSRFNPD